MPRPATRVRRSSKVPARSELAVEPNSIAQSNSVEVDRCGIAIGGGKCVALDEGHSKSESLIEPKVPDVSCRGPHDIGAGTQSASSFTRPWIPGLWMRVTSALTCAPRA